MSNIHNAVGSHDPYHMERENGSKRNQHLVFWQFSSLARPEKFCAIFNRGEVCKLGCADSYHKCNRSGCGGDHPDKHCPSLPRNEQPSVPCVKPILSSGSGNFIISSSLETEAVSQPSVSSQEPSGINVLLNAYTSSQYVPHRVLLYQLSTLRTLLQVITVGKENLEL